MERQHPDVFQQFRATHPFEPLDIKNLENVQGDERDVVFISVTYGRDEAGVIYQRFGPLISDGGERRLNVLISRSRKRCEVFSNITADDLRMDKASKGLQALKQYLSYAQTGRVEVSGPTGEPAKSPFEEEVSALLKQRGYEVHTQVGCEGYRIDLAVLDPAKPGRYLLGVECDGATYHSARSARDRDKLRQRVLEHRGWRLHRIWSPDWWQNRDGEIQRLVDAIEATRADSTEATGAATSIADPEPVEAEVDLNEASRRSVPSAATRPYIMAPIPDDLPTDEDVLQYLAAVVRQEGPIQHELLVSRARVAAGYAKAGRNVRAWLEGLIEAAVRNRTFKAEHGAYVAEETDLDTPRDWSDRPSAERRFDYVPHAELAAAFRIVVNSSFGIDPNEAIRESFRLLGFRRTTDDALSRGHAVIEQMVGARLLILRDGLLRSSET